MHRFKEDSLKGNLSNNAFTREIYPMLVPGIREKISKVDNNILNSLIEIRLRANKPLVLESIKGELFLDKKGQIINSPQRAYFTSERDIVESLDLMTESSLYTLDEEVRAGFLTLAGGHRVGLVGQVISEEGKIKRIKHISSINIRICQEVIGAGDKVFTKIIAGKQDIYNTLIISPPRCGKTTLIRDLARQISDGSSQFAFKGLKVGVVDERSEIGGAYRGVNRNRLGLRTDLLDRCPKAEGMMLLIRSMSPDIIITDEIGSKEDVNALMEAINAGVRVITTVHGSNLEDIRRRPSLKEILNARVFKRIVVLSSRKGPGTVEEVIKG
ncbi:stage III sporulation protein AA [Halonatronum saccharophilum]|uniref:stage III sporulation protein AA n=1 Tax=Halonatronum saccharophilum TaxID=150060 RepID=UPI001FE1282C|nr:stage III sporulation protein AA [Halonatronum saccharophilum]